MSRKVKNASPVDTSAINLRDDRLVGTAEAAVLLGLSSKTLRTLRQERTGPPCFKVGPVKQSRVLYSVKSLERWIAETATLMGGRGR